MSGPSKDNENNDWNGTHQIPPTTTNHHSIRRHSVHIPIGGAGPVGHQVHQVGGSKSGGQRGMGLVGVDGGDDVGSDPIPTPQRSQESLNHSINPSRPGFR